MKSDEAFTTFKDKNAKLKRSTGQVCVHNLYHCLRKEIDQYIGMTYVNHSS